MNRENILRMAREAGMEQDGDNFFSPGHEEIDVHITDLERFVALIAAAEREACAKVCEPKRPRPCDCEYCDCGNSGDRAAVVDWDASNALAAAIRARGNT